MATAMVGFSRSYVAAADLSAKQFHFVELVGADQVNACNAATDIPVGILQNDPRAGEAATVWSSYGVSKVVADGSGTAITRGNWLGTNNVGRAVKKTTNNDFVYGLALDDCSVNGYVIRILIMPCFLGV